MRKTTKLWWKKSKKIQIDVLMDRWTQYCQDVSYFQFNLQIQQYPIKISTNYFIDFDKLILNIRRKKRRSRIDNFVLFFFLSLYWIWASLLAQRVKNLLVMWETWIQSLGQEDPLEMGIATHCSILAWRIPMDIGAWQNTVHGVAKSLHN